MSYELYKNMVDTYNKNEYAFEAAALNWVETAETNPFEIKEARELFFKAQKYCRNWRKGGIDSRSSKRNAVNCVRQIAAMGIAYPYELIEKEEEAKKDLEYKKQLEQEQKQKELEEDKLQQESEEDVQFVLFNMVKLYNENSNEYKQYAVHLMDITLENPFEEDTPEFYKFEEMKEVSGKHNMRKLHLLAAELCEIINKVEIKEQSEEEIKEPMKVLGVLPEEEKEKKNWFKFLHPWKKDGE